MLEMKPVLFNTEMVIANMEGRKSATRRIIKPQPVGEVYHFTGYKTDYWAEEKIDENGIRMCKLKVPYQPGDVLYVRETWRVRNVYGDFKYGNRTAEIEFKAGGEYVYMRVQEDVINGRRWCPSIHMPKEAARLFLKVTSVKAQRLQDILCCPGEIAKEGIPYENAEDWESAAMRFEELWNGTIKPADQSKYGWDANPWVWAIEYERYFPKR